MNRDWIILCTKEAFIWMCNMYNSIYFWAVYQAYFSPSATFAVKILSGPKLYSESFFSSRLPNCLICETKRFKLLFNFLGFRFGRSSSSSELDEESWALCLAVCLTNVRFFVLVVAEAGLVSACKISAPKTGILSGRDRLLSPVVPGREFKLW